MGFGRFIPPEFRQMGFDFHHSADDFARLTADLDEPMMPRDGRMRRTFWLKSQHAALPAMRRFRVK